MSFRKTFTLAKKGAINWFPGHMGKGLTQMQQKLRNVDCVIEVHDARIPFSGRNPDFRNRVIANDSKPHILVLNKKDLLGNKQQRHIKQLLEEESDVKNIVFTNCKNQQCSGIKSLLPLVDSLVSASERYNRSMLKDVSIMIIGVPNVGKSSIVNVLRNRHLKKKGATKVGPLAGVTRSVLEKIKISDDPLVYMVDTPGILEPRISNDEMGMKLALVGCLPDHLVGEDLIADYLLYVLNTQKRFSYVSQLGLQEPCDNIAQVLISSATRMGVTRKVRSYNGVITLLPDVLLAAKHFIQLFRNGSLGHINLDCDFKQNLLLHNN